MSHHYARTASETQKRVVQLLKDKADLVNHLREALQAIETFREQALSLREQMLVLDDSIEATISKLSQALIVKVMQFDVTVQCAEYRAQTFRVEAEDQDAAFHAGLIAADDYDFHDNSVDSAEKLVTAIVSVMPNNSATECS